MGTRKPSISLLRQRMIDDMRMRKFNEKTQLDYVRAMRNFTKFLGRSPDTASFEDPRNYYQPGPIIHDAAYSVAGCLK